MILSIDKQKILESKRQINPVEEACITLLKNPVPVNILEFLNNYRKLPKDKILENLSCLYRLPSLRAIQYFNCVLEYADLSDSVLNKHKDDILTLMENDMEDINREALARSIEIIDDRLNMDTLYEDFTYNVISNRFKKHCMFESYISDQMEILIYNINFAPEAVMDYEELLRKIKTSKTSEHVSSYPLLLKQSTDMILGMDVPVTGDVLELLVSMPTVIADRLVRMNNKSQMVTFIKLIDVELGRIYRGLKTGENSKYNLYKAYVESLSNAKMKLNKHIHLVNESLNALYETLADMQPDVVPYENPSLEEVEDDIERLLAEMICDTGDDIDSVLMEEYIRLANTYVALTEDAGKAIIRGANKVGDNLKKVGNKVQASARQGRRVTTAINKSTEPLTNLISKTVNDLKDADKKERTERIITGKYQFKLSKLIRDGILGIAAVSAGKAVITQGPKAAVGVVAATSSVINPILAAIGILAGVAINKKIDKKYRASILNDLKAELKLVDEKLEDAKSDGERQKKYELMRIKAKLEKDIERIQFNLK